MLLSSHGESSSKICTVSVPSSGGEDPSQEMAMESTDTSVTFGIQVIRAATVKSIDPADLQKAETLSDDFSPVDELTLPGEPVGRPDPCHLDEASFLSPKMCAMPTAASMLSREVSSSPSRRTPSVKAGMSPAASAPSAKPSKRFGGRKRMLVASMTARKSRPHGTGSRPSGETVLSFLRGTGPGPEGECLGTVLAWDLERLERQHDYIQWLFPTDIPSDFHKSAPLLTPELQDEMLEDFVIGDNLERSFVVFLKFLGLEKCHEQEPAKIGTDVDSSSSSGLRRSPASSAPPVKVCKAQSFEERRKVCWVVNCPEGNHNWFRISRVLVSLRLLGFSEEAQALYRCLEYLWMNRDLPAFAINSFKVWRQNAGEESRPLPKRKPSSKAAGRCCVVS